MNTSLFLFALMFAVSAPAAWAAEVTGVLTYPAGTALPAGAVVEAEVRDDFASDIPNVVAHMETPAAPPSQKIVLKVDAAKIQSHHPYSFVVSVKSAGRYVLTSAEKYPVLTQGKGSSVNVALTPLPVSPETKPYTPALEETYWKLTSVGGATVAGSKKEPFLRLDAFNHRLSGTGGCNNFQGGYAADAQTVTFQDVGSTRMACPAGTHHDDALLKAMQGVRRWQIVGEQLTFLDGQGGILATFKAVAPQPVHPIPNPPKSPEPGPGFELR